VSLRVAASMLGLQTGVSMVLGFLSIKVTAVYLGPAGLGLVAQLTLFMAMTQGLLVAGLHTGLVRAIASAGTDTASRDRVVASSLRAVIAVGAAAAALVALGSKWIAAELLHDAAFQPILLVLAAAFVPGLVSTVIMACANGASDFRTPTFINISVGVCSFLMMVGLCRFYGLPGGLLAAAALPLVSCAVAWGFARRNAWWPERPLSHFSWGELRSVAGFVPLALISSVAAPLQQIAIRDTVVAHAGLDAVGLLQGAGRISDMYFGIAATILSMYFFPRFSRSQQAAPLLREMVLAATTVVPAVALVGVVIFVLRDPIIEIVFTPEFRPMRDLMFWQMAGTIAKIVGMLFSFALLSKAKGCALVAYGMLELAPVVVWWWLAVLFIPNDGAAGVPKAYAISNLLYATVAAIAMAFVLRASGTFAQTRASQ
jgi:O-antigen/teichoic acid export membrane protein